MFSNNWGAIYFPPEVLKSCFFLSVIFKKPSLSRTPISPVWKYPFIITSDVFFISLNYPFIMFGPLHIISPSSAILISTPSIGFPTHPILNPLFLMSLTVNTGDVSVRP